MHEVGRVELERERDEHRLGVGMLELVDAPVDDDAFGAGVERIDDRRRRDAGGFDMDGDRGAALEDLGLAERHLGRGLAPPRRVLVAGEELGLVEVDVGDGQPVVGRVDRLVDVFARAPALVLAGEIVALRLVEELGDGAGLAVDPEPVVLVLDGVAAGLEVAGRHAALQVEEGVAHRRDGAGDAADLGDGAWRRPSCCGG